MAVISVGNGDKWARENMGKGILILSGIAPVRRNHHELGIESGSTHDKPEQESLSGTMKRIGLDTQLEKSIPRRAPKTILSDDEMVQLYGSKIESVE